MPHAVEPTLPHISGEQSFDNLVRELAPYVIPHNLEGSS